MSFKQLCHWFIILFLYSLSFFAIITPVYSLEDKIAAVVNDEVITQSEVQKQVDERKKQMSQANMILPSEKELRHSVLNELIDRNLVLQIAARNNFTVKDKEVDAAIADIAKRNKMTLTQFQQALQKTGINFKGYRESIREEMIIRRIEQQAMGGKVTVSDQEIANYMRKAKEFNVAATSRAYHIIDILLPVAEKASDQEKQDAKMEAFKVVDRLQKGEALNKVVQTTQVGNKTLVSSDLGMRKMSDLPDIFVSYVVNLKSGDVAGPIAAPNGLHIIKVLEVKDIAGPKQNEINFSEENARQMALQHKFEELLKPWLQQLRSTAYIKIEDENN